MPSSGSARAPCAGVPDEGCCGVARIGSAANTRITQASVRTLRILGQHSLRATRGPPPHSSWKHEIELPPVLLRCRALARPIRRVIQLVGNVRRPEAPEVTVEDVALDRLTQPGGAPCGIGLP